MAYEDRLKTLAAEKAEQDKEKLELVKTKVEAREEAQRKLVATDLDSRKAIWAANKRFEVSNSKFKFPRARTYELYRARSRLYRSQILQVNMRLKALAEIYTMHYFAQLCAASN